MEEVWKDIVGFENIYQVSNLGAIRSLDKRVKTKGGKTRLVKGKLRIPQIKADGYVITSLWHLGKCKTMSVHQIVAKAFLPGFVQGTELNHIDGNKQNNSISNLEISNRSHNQLHALSTGLKRSSGRSKYLHVSYRNNPNSRSPWIGSIRHNGNNSYGWKSFKTEIEAAHYVDSLLDSIQDTKRLRNFP